MIWFFTFGSAHTDAVTGESLANSYVRIEADSEADARRIMCDLPPAHRALREGSDR